LKQSLHLPYDFQLSQGNVSSQNLHTRARCVALRGNGDHFLLLVSLASVPSLPCPCLVLNQRDGAFYLRNKPFVINDRLVS
jgi:hypothetical protein